MGSERPAAIRRPHVLLAVDPDEISSIERALEGRGYRVSRASDGQAALDILYGEPVPEVMLLDLMTPVMNGWQLLAALWSDPGIAPGVQVVVLTAAPPQSFEELRPLVAGALRKPFELDRLFEALERALFG